MPASFYGQQIRGFLVCQRTEREYEISLRSPNDLHLIRSKRCGGRRLVRPLFYYANGWIALASADKSIQ